MTTTDLQGRTLLVTGASSGIGRAMAEALAARGASVVLTARSGERARPVLEAIRHRNPGADAELLIFDLSDLSDVRRAAEQFLASGRRLDVLVNNAGVAGTEDLSRDGFDRTYATNHIGPFLLTSLLLPRLREAPQGRVVNVSSIAHTTAKGIDWATLEQRKTPKRSGFPDYAATKLMNILHAKELARRVAGTPITTYAVHPGGVASNIWRALPQVVQWPLKLFLISNEAGAQTQLYCATSPELATTTGRYYDKCREVNPSELARDGALARELWERTERAIGS